MIYPVKHFHSGMRGAPVLSGSVGAMLAAIRACLITGFGAVSVTGITVSAGVATATIPSGVVYPVQSIVLVDGATPAGLNGEQRVIASSSTTVSWATTEPAGAATGTISLKVAPTTGWAEIYTGINAAVFRSTDPTGTGCYFRIDDAGTTTARVVGYESMSDINTGIGAFPTAAQISGGGYWGKSTTANSNANLWTLVADSRMFDLGVAVNSGANPLNVVHVLRGFGDMLVSRAIGDAYACALGAPSSASAATTSMDGCFDYLTSPNNIYVPRSHTGLGSALAYGSRGYVGGAVNQVSGNEGVLGSFPGQVDGALRLSSRYLTVTGADGPRCDIPGVYTVPQNGLAATFASRDTVFFNGRTLLAVPAGSTPNGAQLGSSFIDITGPWR